MGSRGQSSRKRIHQRTEGQGGRIGKDGLITRNKDEKTDVLVKKGREPKAQRKEAKNARMTAGDWIKNQVNVDIEKYRDSATKQFDRRGYITVNWRSMPRTERAYIEQLAQKYPNRIQLFDAGVWAKQIRFKR